MRPGNLLLCLCVLILPLGACANQPTRHAFEDDLDRLEVNMVLTAWHLAADHGLYEFYFDQMTDDAVFMGTDASERWTKDEFMAYAREPFSDGHGWSYEQVEHHVAFSHDHRTAWVDEILENEQYGTMRGTAVLELINGEWKIAHYSLTFLVPNERAGEVVRVIAGD